MDQTADDAVIDEQPDSGPLFDITVDAATLALLGISPEQLITPPETIPEDPGFNEEAWQQQLLVDIAILEAEEPLDGDAVRPGAGAVAGPAAGFDPAWGVLPFDPGPAVPAAERVERVVEINRHICRLQALERRELAALTADVEAQLPADAGTGQREWAHRSMLAELAVACRVSKPTMAGRIAEADLIVHAFPATLKALEAGVIQAGHVRVIAGEGGLIEDEERRARYEHLVLERAVTVTAGRLKNFARRTAIRVGKVSFEDRHAAAREGRCVRIRTLDDGMSEIYLYVSTVLAAPIFDRLTQQAKAISHHPCAGSNDQTNGEGGDSRDNNDGDSDGDSSTGSGQQVRDPRSFDQLRADLACELLLTGQPSADPDAPHAAGVGIRAEVSVVIPVLSLLGHSSDAAIIPGQGPIGLDEACRLAADAPELIRILTHPVTGMVLAVDTYRPSKRLRDYLHARDGRCRFPVCNRNPRRTEIDHTFDWEYGGKTRPDNLECLCKSDHLLKHQTDWTVKQISPGILEWTSPLGRVITDYPDSDIPGSTLDAPF
jgi:hypothetical protein